LLHALKNGRDSGEGQKPAWADLVCRVAHVEHLAANLQTTAGPICLEWDYTHSHRLRELLNMSSEAVEACQDKAKILYVASEPVRSRVTVN